jgi:hypothetical protein
MTHEQRLAELVEAGENLDDGTYTAEQEAGAWEVFCGDENGKFTWTEELSGHDAKFIVQAANARETIALAAKGIGVAIKVYEARKAEWIEAVTKEYDAEYAERQFKDWHLGLEWEGFGTLLKQWKGRQ